MTKLTRRQFIKGVGAIATASLINPRSRPSVPVASARAGAATHHVYVARNGTPVTNVQAVIDLAGGIASFVGYDDVVVLKPNGQWSRQGYTHTQCMKALIDVILNRPGGFDGEIIISEHVHRNPTTAMSSSYCWNMSAGSNSLNNWPDMNYLQLEADYHTGGHSNVTAIPMYDVSQDGDHWASVSGPGDVPAGKHGWVRLSSYTAGNGRKYYPSYAILRSGYSDKLIDLQNGVWESGDYNSQQVKLIFLPTLNNHSYFNNEDYAGPTSAVKCHIGFIEGTSLHSVGYSSSDNRPDAVGESVGHLITEILSPAFYLTCAEYTGHRSRTSSTAAHTKTVGLCADPVTLDYWMCKYVMYTIATSQTFMNPDNDNNLRQTLLGCHSKGVGTLDEGEMSVHIRDINLDEKVYLPLVAR